MSIIRSFHLSNDTDVLNFRLPTAGYYKVVLKSYAYKETHITALGANNTLTPTDPIPTPPEGYFENVGALPTTVKAIEFQLDQLMPDNGSQNPILYNFNGYQKINFLYNELTYINNTNIKYKLINKEDDSLIVLAKNAQTLTLIFEITKC